MQTTILKIYHPGCWGSNIGIKFPKLKHSSIDCRNVKGKISHILVSSGDPKYFSNIIKYMKNRKDVKSVEVLSKTNEELCLQTITKNDKNHRQFSQIFFENECFPVKPTLFVDKYEIWTLGTSDRKNIKKIYLHLKKKHDVKIISLKDEKIRSELTNKQRDALMYAIHFGYYDWPRKKSVKEICRIVKIPKTVFLSHLRKAEIKIIGNYFNRP